MFWQTVAMNMSFRALKKLKQEGVRIALDDFGTGHSSMTHIRDYPVDSLKIDYNFVSRMHEEKSIKAIVEGIAKLGPILSFRYYCRRD